MKLELAMITVPLAQAKVQLSELISRVEAGKTAAVTRRGKPVVRLLVGYGDETPTEPSRKVEQAFANLFRLRKGVSIEGDLKDVARQGLA